LTWERAGFGLGAHHEPVGRCVVLQTTTAERNAWLIDRRNVVSDENGIDVVPTAPAPSRIAA
jgi:hypothetical protein